MAVQKPKPSFEDSLESLEEIVELLENQETGLEEALGHYKNGVDIAVGLNKRLSVIEKEVKMLSQKLDGSFELTAFDEDDADDK